MTILLFILREEYFNTTRSCEQDTNSQQSSSWLDPRAPRRLYENQSLA